MLFARKLTVVLGFFSLLPGAGGLAGGAAGAGEPKKVESTIRFIDASVTWLSQDPRNANMAEAAEGVPANHGLAEEALSYRPDLVLAGLFTERSTVALLGQVGAPVVEFSVPGDARRRAAPNSRSRGRRSASRSAARRWSPTSIVVWRESPLDPRRPPLRAIILRPNGFTVGPGSLVDEILRRAGMTNLAAAARYRRLSADFVGDGWPCSTRTC